MSASRTSPGIIEPANIYTLPEAKRRLGVGDSWFRRARREGLKVRYIGGRGFLSGADIVEYLLSVPQAKPASPSDCSEVFNDDTIALPARMSKRLVNRDPP